MKAAVPPVTAARRAGSADHVPAGRRAAWMSAGVGAAVVLAAVADVALTFLARDDFKGNDLVFNLAVPAAAVAYATLRREFGTDLDGQTSLANTTDAGQRDQAMGPHQIGDIVDLEIAPDERTDLAREVAGEFVDAAQHGEL